METRIDKDSNNRKKKKEKKKAKQQKKNRDAKVMKITREIPI